MPPPPASPAASAATRSASSTLGATAATPTPESASALGFTPPPPPPAPAQVAVASFIVALLKGMEVKATVLHAAKPAAPGGAAAPGFALAAAPQSTTVTLDVVTVPGAPTLRWSGSLSGGAAATPRSAAAFEAPLSSLLAVQLGPPPRLMGVLPAAGTGAGAAAAAMPPADKCVTIATSAPLSGRPGEGFTPNAAAGAGGSGVPINTVLLECLDGQEAAFVSSCLWDVLQAPGKIERALGALQKKGLWSPEGGVVA